MKVASVRLFVGTPSSGAVSRVFNITVDGVEQAPFPVAGDVVDCLVTIPASTPFSFKTATTNAQGLTATSEVYSATLGDLTGTPDQGLGHEVVSVSEQ